MKNICIFKVNEFELSVVEAYIDTDIRLSRILVNKISRKKHKETGRFIGDLLIEEQINYENSILLMEDYDIPVHILKLPLIITVQEIKKIVKGQLPQNGKHKMQY